MSSGDDLDEDELLQMALKEQSQRNINYQKPSQAASKPVRNYVQPPANRGAGRITNTVVKQKKDINHQKKQSMDEDDDSEVEMLSISSGDEDDRSAVAPRNRAGRGEDDDRPWDGEEPSCWKHVNEAELARRVREMRDTKVVPVAPKIEKKPKNLTSVQSLPRGMEWVDPLGLGDNISNMTSSVDVEPLEPSARVHEGFSFSWRPTNNNSNPRSSTR